MSVSVINDEEKLGYMGLAVTLIREKRPGMDHGEVISIGWEAICRCSNNWDPDKGAFGTLLRYHVRSVMQGRMAESSIVRLPDKRYRKSGPLSFTNEEWEFTDEDESGPFRSDDYDLMWRVAYEELSSRELLVVQLHYMKGWKLRHIALALDLSKQRVHQIMKRALEKLKEVIDDSSG